MTRTGATSWYIGAEQVGSGKSSVLRCVGGEEYMRTRSGGRAEAQIWAGLVLPPSQHPIRADHPRLKTQAWAYNVLEAYGTEREREDEIAEYMLIFV